MKIDKKTKIEAACIKDQTRMALAHPYLDRSAEGDKLVATNGKMLAVVPVECDDEDVAGYVPAECLKDTRKFGGVILNGVAQVWGGASYPRPDLTFPNWRQVIPTNEGKKVVRLGIDPALLKSLADAIGAEQVCLEIPLPADESKFGGSIVDPLTVRPAGHKPTNPAAFGVIMPVRVG